MEISNAKMLFGVVAGVLLAGAFWFVVQHGSLKGDHGPEIEATNMVRELR
jgi:hypothetical protein